MLLDHDKRGCRVKTCYIKTIPITKFLYQELLVQGWHVKIDYASRRLSGGKKFRSMRKGWWKMIIWSVLGSTALTPNFFYLISNLLTSGKVKTRLCGRSRYSKVINFEGQRVIVGRIVPLTFWLQWTENYSNQRPTYTM